MKISVLVMVAVICSACQTEFGHGEMSQSVISPQTCTPAPQCTQQDYDNGTCCSCEGGCCPNSPIVIDVAGDGIHLSSAADGVLWELDPGRQGQWAWTLPGTDDAWLALDRNGNGVIDNGGELFGNNTIQLVDADRDGFKALAYLDALSQGGNGDGIIDHRDAVWDKLRLWTDINHDAISQPTELVTLDSVGIHSLSTTATPSGYIDPNGNEFRLTAPIIADDPVADTATDVWLKQAPVTAPQEVCTTWWYCLAHAYVLSSDVDPNTGINGPCSIPSVINLGTVSFDGRSYRWVSGYGQDHVLAASQQQSAQQLFGQMQSGQQYCVFGPVRNPDPLYPEGFNVVAHGPIGPIPAFSFGQSCAQATVCTGGGGCGG